MPKRLTDLTNVITDPSDADLMHLVDVSDTTSDPAGTSGKMTMQTLFNGTYTSTLGLDAVQYAPGNVAPTFSEGLTFYDDDEKAIGFYSNVNNLVFHPLHEEAIRVTNKTGVTLTKGQVVYINGAQGQRPTVALAKADAEATSAGTIGVITADIADNNTGYCSTSGRLTGLDTSAFTDGAALYLSETVAGGIVAVEPEAPNHAVRLGFCTYAHPTEGSVELRIDNGYELDELHDVHYVDALTNYDLLQWNSTNLRWENLRGQALDTSASPTFTDLTLSNMVLGSPTYTTIYDMHNGFHSAGWIDGGTITDAGGGTVDVAAGSGFIRVAATALSGLKHFDWSASLGNTVLSNTVKYVGVEYNAGSPQVVLRDTYNWNFYTDFPLGSVVNAGGTLHIENASHAIGDHASTMIQRTFGTMGIQRDDYVGGLILSETGTRNVTVTAGTLWHRLTSFAIGAIDTSVADTFTRYYLLNGAWTPQASRTQWDNTQYNDVSTPGSETLATMTGNFYSVQYFYLELDGDLTSVYGQAEYATLAQANADEAPSSLPDRIAVHGKLIGRIIFQNGASVATTIDTVFRTFFNNTGVTDHDNLGNISGGTAGEYYHLTAAQHTALQNIGGFTPDSVLFVGASGEITENNANFSFNSNYYLYVGGRISTREYRVTFDASNYVSLQTSSVGDLNISPTGKVGILQSAPDFYFHVGDDTTIVLGTTSGDTVGLIKTEIDSANSDKLEWFSERTANGSDWTTTVHKLQRVVDVTKMGYISFGRNTSDLISFGNGTTEYMRVTSLGNFDIYSGDLWITRSNAGEVRAVIDNYSSSSSAYAALRISTDQSGDFIIFKNSTARTTDGGINTTTLRNDGGSVRLYDSNSRGFESITGLAYMNLYLHGTGYKHCRIETGKYDITSKSSPQTITFNNGFTAAPVVLLTGDDAGGGFGSIKHDTVTTTNFVLAWSGIPSTSKIHWIAIGY